MKNRYGAWHQPLLAFYSKKLYRDIAGNWKGTNLAYLFVLLALCLLPAALKTSRETIALIEKASATYLIQIPQMRFTAGRLAVDAPQPYSIIAGNRTVLMIDTTGKINTLEEAGADALLTASHLLIKQERNSPLIYNLSTLKDFELNQAMATDLVARIKRLILPAYYATALLFSYAMLVLAAVLSGALVLLFGRIQQRKPNYTAGLRLAVAAFTPPLILATLLRMAGLTLPIAFHILLALGFLYLAASASGGASGKVHLCLDGEKVGR